MQLAGRSSSSEIEGVSKSAVSERVSVIFTFQAVLDAVVALASSSAVSKPNAHEETHASALEPGARRNASNGKTATIAKGATITIAKA